MTGSNVHPLSLSPPSVPPPTGVPGSPQTDRAVLCHQILEKKKIHPKGVKQIMAERNVLIQNLQHPFLVGLHYSFQTSSKLYFVLDYVNGGELFFHLKKGAFGEARARWED